MVLMKKLALVFGLGLLVAGPLHGFEKGLVARPENPLKVTVGLNPFQSQFLEPDQVTEMVAQLELPEGYKAYEEQFKISISDPSSNFKVGSLKISPIQDFYDDFSKKQRRGMIGKAELRAVIEAPMNLEPEGEIPIQLTYQACTKTFCLFPKHLKFSVPYRTKASIPSEPTLSQDLPGHEGHGHNQSFWSKLKFDDVFEQGLVWAFLFSFLGGVLTSLTPCVFPMIPITIAVLTQGADKRNRWQSLFISVIYVLGIALTYSLMGIIAASTGSLFGSLFSSNIFLGVTCAVFLVMSLSLFGYFEIQPPAFIRDRMSKWGSGGGTANAFISGIIAGVVASPCVGPILVGILAYVAKSQNLVLGFWLLFVFALGMGVLFIVIGVSTQATKLLPKSGAWMDSVKAVSGLMMLGVFYYYLSFLLSDRLWDLAFGAGLLILGFVGGGFKPMGPGRLGKIRKGLCLAFLISGLGVFAIGALDLRPTLAHSNKKEPGFNVNTLKWKDLTEAALLEAKNKGRPVIIDFFAEWCAACHELDKHTFTNQQVQLMAQNFELLRFDATKESPELDIFREKFKIVGLPWVVFIDRKGEWIEDLTVTGFEEASPFLQRMNKAAQK